MVLTVHNLVTQTLPHWDSMSVADVEVAITLMYMLGEALPVRFYYSS